MIISPDMYIIFTSAEFPHHFLFYSKAPGLFYLNSGFPHRFSVHSESSYAFFSFIVNLFALYISVVYPRLFSIFFFEFNG